MMRPISFQPGSGWGDDLLTNGSFETGALANWNVGVSGTLPVTQTANVQDGVVAVQLGGAGLPAAGTAFVEQTFCLAASGTEPPYLSLQYKIVGTPNSEASSWMRVYLNGTQVGTFFEDTHGLWKQFYMNLSAYQGRKVTVRVASWSVDGAGAVSYYLDKVSVRGRRLGTAADFNGDGMADALVRQPASPNVYQLVSGPAGWNWAASAFAGFDSAYTSVYLGDLDGDGHTDALVRDPVTGYAYQLFMAPGGGWDWTRAAWAGLDPAYTLLYPGDYSGDGRMDVLLRHPTLGTAVVLPTSPNGGLDAPSATSSAWDPLFTEVFPGRFNADSRQDVLVRKPSTGEAALIFAGRNGALDWASRIPATWTASYSQVYPGVFSGDGRTGLLVRDPVSGDAYILRAAANGLGWDWGASTYVGWDSDCSEVYVGDFTGDGVDDLLVREPGTAEAFILPVLPAGGINWAAAAYVGWDQAYTQVQVADFTGDGKTDALVRDPATGLAYLLVSNGTGWGQFVFVPWDPTYSDVTTTTGR